MSFYEELTALMQKYAPDPGKLSLDPENKNDPGNVEPETSSLGQATRNPGQETSNLGQETSNLGQETSNLGQDTSKTEDQTTSGTLEANIQWLKDVLYRPAPEPTKDPVEEFLDRPDGPLARYSLHTGKEK